MTQEEKAKAYDEAVNKLRRFMEQGIDPLITRADVQDFFPELKESEDERIRKDVLAFIRREGQHIDKYKWHKWIAWIEKQGEKKQDVRYENLEELLVADDIYQMAMNDEMVQEAKEKAINALSEMCIGRLLGVEKQSEQEKPQVYKTDDGEVITYSKSEGYKVIEPKFKVGDWILYSGDHYEGVRHITKINENGYYIERNGLPHGIIPFNHEICMRLWTIQDAKPGDILFHSDTASNGIFIFKELLKYEFCEEVRCYCDYDSEDHFCLGEHHTCCWADAKILHPATKEQRNLLFSKMKEAGYEWDAEKKELKKIDNEEVNGEDYGIDGLWHAQRILENTLGNVYGYQTDDGILDHKAAITAVKKLYKQKHT